MGKKILIILFLTMMCSTIQAEPIRSKSSAAKSESAQLIHAASHVADNAWESFHKAAIEGTLASPEIQSDIEQKLQEIRELLRKARQAQHEGNNTEVKGLTSQIQAMAREIIKESKREKE